MAYTLSEDLKWRIIFLRHNGYSRKKIAELLCISRGLVDKILQELVKEKVDWYLDELVEELELQTGKRVSIPTLWRSLIYCGISRKKFYHTSYIRHPMSEMNFSEIHLLQKLDVNLDLTNLFLWMKLQKMNILYLVGFTIAVDIMEGSCTKKRFREFVISNMVPQMNSYPNKHSVLVLDNAQIHHNDILIEYIEAFACSQITPQTKWLQNMAKWPMANPGQILAK
ncbi:unnamed protein product [Rhizophagus irregularis]|nr:unnamed protein product [Rhizophagus irregularis]